MAEVKRRPLDVVVTREGNYSRRWAFTSRPTTGLAVAEKPRMAAGVNTFQLGESKELKPREKG